MFAHEVACHVGEGGGAVGVGGLGGGWEVGGDLLPAPGAAEVEAVEVGDLAVGAVGGGDGVEQGGGAAAGDVGEEGREPGGEAVGVEAADAGGLDEGGGEELVLAGLPGLAVFVGAVPGPGFSWKRARRAGSLASA